MSVQDNVVWLAEFAYPEYITDDENDGEWDVRYFSNLKPAGIKSNSPFSSSFVQVCERVCVCVCVCVCVYVCA